MEAGIQQLLVANYSLNPLVGTRIYPVILPEKPTLPAITFQRISTVRDYTTTGPVSLTRVRLQVDCWASTYGSVKQIADAVQSSLEFFHGTLPDGTQVQVITQDGSNDLYEDDTNYYRVSADYIILAAL